jgi:hypothetical protein
MDLSPLQQHDSAALDGVKFTVRRLNYIARCERDLKILDDRSKLNGIMEQMRALCDGGEVGNPAAGHEQEYRKLDAEYAMLHQTRIIPAYIRAGLVSVEGLTMDGAAADTAAILRAAPDAFLDEIFAACFAASDLSEAQRKNSQSPGSSDAPEAGQTSNMTAPAVSE